MKVVTEPLVAIHVSTVHQELPFPALSGQKSVNKVNLMAH
jgi:hypothetical protein